jgi:hypothetical protein
MWSLLSWRRAAGDVDRCVHGRWCLRADDVEWRARSQRLRSVGLRAVPQVRRVASASACTDDESADAVRTEGSDKRCVVCSHAAAHAVMYPLNYLPANRETFLECGACGCDGDTRAAAEALACVRVPRRSDEPCVSALVCGRCALVREGVAEALRDRRAGHGWSLGESAARTSDPRSSRMASAHTLQRATPKLYWST